MNDKKTILIVDDDIDFLTQMQIHFSEHNFNVITAEGQKRAEAILQKQLPDLAIIDLMMEDVDGGFALAYHIKKMNSFIPVIIATAVSSETGMEFDATTEEERSWVKADVFLAKPIRFEQLLREVNRLLAE
ncbi:response regulator [candidate division KSB1 bacterium]|nr:response regulator [candidate division KSB1 bacterium]